MKFRQYIAILPFILFGVVCFAQDNVSFERISREQGLSQSIVETIMQDSRGAMWFGTGSGLNLYYGNRFKVFSHDPRDESSLSSSDITSLCEDSAGNIWVGTYKGLNKLDIATMRFERFFRDPEGDSGPVGDFIRSMLEDSDGNLWIGTRSGLSRRDPVTGRFHQYFPKPEDPTALYGPEVYAIIEDSDGTLWIGTSDYALHKYDKKTDSFKRYILPTHFSQPISPGRRPSWFSIFEDSQGTLWTGVGVYGLFRFDRDKEEFIPFNQKFNEFLNESKTLTSTINEDSAGCLWVGLDNEGGLVRISTDRNRYRFFKHKPYDQNSPVNDTIYVIYRDLSGLLWVGHGSEGLTKIVMDKFKRLKYDPFDDFSLSSDYVGAVYEDSQGILWTGNLDGIDRFDRMNRTRKTFVKVGSGEKSLPLGKVYLITEDDPQHLLIGGNGIGLIRVDKQFKSFEYVVETNYARDLIRDRSGNMWVAAGYNGLYKLNQKTGEKVHYFSSDTSNLHFEDNFVRNILQDPDGNFWIGTTNGLFHYYPASGEVKTYKANPEKEGSLLDGNIECMHLAANGALWIGTNGGLHVYDSKEDTFRAYTVYDGLPDNIIYGILEDDKGNLWMSTNNGLSKFDPGKRDFHNFDIKDGIQSPEFNVGVAFKSKSGEMFFGGLKGLNIFHPDGIRISDFNPPIIITSFKYGGHLREYYFGAPENEIFTLGYEDRDITIEFAGLDYGTRQNLYYEYKLESQKAHWQQAGTLGFASFTNLPHGEYVFQVRPTNADGVLGSKVATLRFKIIPPYWETFWFQALLVISIFGLAAGIYWLRLRSIRKQTGVLQHEVDARTKELQQANVMLRKEIAERKRIERQLRTYQEKLRSMASEISLTSERERRRFAFELHESIGQTLALSKLKLSELIRKQSSEKFADSLSEILEFLNSVIHETRSLTYDISPPDLYELGFEAAAESLVDRLGEEHGLKTEFDAKGEAIPKDNEVSIILYQLLREMLLYIIHNSNADRVKISIDRREDIATVKIFENGSGIDYEKAFHEADSEDIGLFSIRERIELTGGRMDVVEVPDQGTLMTFFAPLNAGTSKQSVK